MPIEFHREGPWELPVGWVWARAGDVLPIEYGKGLPERVRDSTGSVPVYGSAGIVGTHISSMVDEPCLIIARKGSVGSVFEATNPCWPIDTVYFARQSPVLDRRYAYWFIDFAKLAKLDQSTAVPSLSRDKYNEVQIAVPPLAEQRRIVSRIDQLFTEIVDGETTLTRARDDLDTWRRALLKAAVTGELTREWREHSRPNETGEDVVERLRLALAQALGAIVRFGRRVTVEDQIEVDVANLPELPSGWCWSRVGEIGHVSGGLTKNPARAEIDRKLPFLRVANVQYGDLDLTEMHEIGVSNSELDRVLLQQNDLLIVEGNGSVDQIGRCAIWTGEIVPCVHQNHLIKARFVDAEIAQWAFHWLMSPHGRQLVTTVASSTSGLHTLSISKIRAIPVPVPPFMEIVEILKVLSAETDAEGTIEVELSTGSKTIDPLRQAILKAAFEGRLVQQDPSEEPADRLLARLNECAPQSRSRARRSRSVVEANA